MGKAYDLACQAVAREELEQLFRGVPPYVYRGVWSSSPDPSDLVDLYRYGVCKYAAENPDYDMQGAVECTFPRLLNDANGISAAATLYFQAVLAQEDPEGIPPLGLDLPRLSLLLSEAIVKHADVLRNHRTGGGYGWPQGLLDDLRRLSGLAVVHGGPAFVKHEL